MFYNEHRGVVKLLSRNEGKLKRYESCTDLRAWSHNEVTRCTYLKAWIRSDMPRCVLPSRVLTQFLLRRTNNICQKAIPRCNPDCKSKRVLESIFTVSQVIKDWLKDYKDFEKYFQEEEYETSHWPCERYIEALKSIAMFWKIISEKIFNVPDIKATKFTDMNNKSNVRNVVKNWQNDMIDKINCAKKLIYSADIKRDNKEEGVDCCFCTNKTRGTCTIERKVRRVNRYASVRVKTNDKDTDAPEFLCKMIVHYEQRLNFLDKQIVKRDQEIEKLYSENQCLKSKIDSLEKVKHQVSHISLRRPKPVNGALATPFGEPYNSFTEIDSEMIITMKKCADKNFKHISMLQVLHKTNQPISSDLDLSELCQKKEDPIELLRKGGNFISKYLRIPKILRSATGIKQIDFSVQSAFGMFVKREMIIANGRRSPREKVDINTTSSVQNVMSDDESTNKEDFNRYNLYTANCLTEIDTSISNVDEQTTDVNSDLETFTCCTSTVTCSK